LLQTQSLEWFYTNVKSRFKRFGSAKVLKTLYKKHLVQHGVLSELTEGSAYEESICNEGSVCGSDSTFYRQSEEHSMAETLTVALRVAEEAIDEAISKAEFDTANQQKQNEALYLREHRGELIEELAKTIVQKIINRRKTLGEIKPEFDQDWPLDHKTELHQHLPTCSSLNQPSLWRSRSAFSLLDNDLPDLNSGVSQKKDPLQGLKKEGGGSAMSTWKSVDRLDNSSVSSVLKSPDGNWIALQSAQLSRPSLLTKRKSLVYSALEKESGVVSAYEGMGSDNEAKPEPDSCWGAALQEFHRKMADSNFNLQDTQDTHSHQSRTSSPLMGRRGSRDALFSDSEGNLKPNKPLLAIFKLPQEIKRPSSSRRTSIIDVNFNPEGAREESSGAAEVEVGKVRRSRKKRRSKKEQVPASSSEPDYNNIPLDMLVNKCNVNKGNQSQHASDAVAPDTLTSEATTLEPFDLDDDVTGGGANQMVQELTFRLQQLASQVSISHLSTSEDELDGGRDDEGQKEEKEREGGRERDQEEDETLWKMDVDVDGGRTEDEKEKEEDDEEMKYKLYRLVAQSTLTYFSSTDDELDRAGQSEEERKEDMEEENGEQKEGRTEALTFKLCQLEKQTGANQFSSTEDELDRVGFSDGERERGEEEDGKKEELVAKLCRIASQVNATQFSSTEDELDRAGIGEGEEEEATDEETLWIMEAKKAVQAAQVRDLASLVSASQFSSTEDELDRVGGKEGEREEEVNKGELDTESAAEREEPWLMKIGREGVAEKIEERRRSVGGLDVKMFDFGDEVDSEGEKPTDANKVEKDIRSGESSEETVSDSERKVEAVRQDETEAQEPEKKGCVGERVREERNEDERRVEEQTGTVDVLTEALGEREKETDERQEKELDVEVEAERLKERTEERIATALHETRVPRENILQHQPEAERSDEKEGGERQAEGKTREVTERRGKWETAESDEDDVEFDRIISSMLMMSLDEMQVDTLADKVEDEFGEIRGRNKELEEVDENDKIGGETGNIEKTVDAQSTNVSKEAVSTEEIRSGGDNMMPEPVVSEGEIDDFERENVIEQNEGEVCRKSGVAININAQQETETYPPERLTQPNLETQHTIDVTINDMHEERDEAKWTCKRKEAHEEEREETRGKMQMRERQGDPAGESEERDCERKETDETFKGTKEKSAEAVEQSAASDLEGVLSPEEIQNRYSAVSLCSITTEVLKVLNATEELLQGVEGGDSGPRPSGPSLPPNTDPNKLDQQFSRLEENVYVAAGAVYSLEAELSDLEECARGISGATSDCELSFLEEQVASAAAKVQQSELQISDISARIAALKSAGLNVDPQSRFTKARTIPVMPITLDSSRQLRRRLPAPPVKEDKEP
ncbi:myosin heavy chain, skeletal muscle-like, partial [Centroberyx affinis]|uniref:myosin heavy chain, skeletal muscle-like n=1 Tax=Centroberyx affinis TaxID=166261 RepID=UPI003A5B9E72